MTGVSSDSNNWWARVNYIHLENKKESIPVAEIVYAIGPKPTQQKTKFQPKTLADFNSKQLYLVMTDKDSADGSIHSYKVLIGRMYGE